jgi:hypothetical protein
MAITGKIVGYDPGGNGNHGVASLVVDCGKPVSLAFATVKNAEAAIRWFSADFRGPKFTYNETIVGTGRQG